MEIAVDQLKSTKADEVMFSDVTGQDRQYWLHSTMESAANALPLWLKIATSVPQCKT